MDANDFIGIQPMTSPTGKIMRLHLRRGTPAMMAVKRKNGGFEIVYVFHYSAKPTIKTIPFEDIVYHTYHHTRQGK